MSITTANPNAGDTHSHWVRPQSLRTSWPTQRLATHVATAANPEAANPEESTRAG